MVLEKNMKSQVSHNDHGNCCLLCYIAQDYGSVFCHHLAVRGSIICIGIYENCTVVLYKAMIRHLHIFILVQDYGVAVINQCHCPMLWRCFDIPKSSFKTIALRYSAHNIAEIITKGYGMAVIHGTPTCISISLVNAMVLLGYRYTCIIVQD